MNTYCYFSLLLLENILQKYLSHLLSCSVKSKQCLPVFRLDSMISWLSTWMVYKAVCFTASIEVSLSCGDAQGLAPARWNKSKQAVRSNPISQTLDMRMHQHIYPSAPRASGHSQTTSQTAPEKDNQSIFIICLIWMYPIWTIRIVVI